MEGLDSAVVEYGLTKCDFNHFLIELLSVHIDSHPSMSQLPSRSETHLWGLQNCNAPADTSGRQNYGDSPSAVGV